MKIKNITNQTLILHGVALEAGQEVLVASKNYDHNYRTLVKAGKLKVLDETRKIEVKKSRKVKINPAVDSEKIGDEK